MTLRDMDPLMVSMLFAGTAGISVALLFFFMERWDHRKKKIH